MKKVYLLKDLIRFWQRQMQIGFPVIEAVVNLAEFRGVANSKKEEIILSVLRNHGLFDVDYSGDKTFIIEEIQMPIVELELLNHFELPEGRFDVTMELFNLKILNAHIQFSMILN